MSERCERSRANVLGENTCFREDVCIHTNKIYDTCRDKDCLEDVRCFFTACDQELVDRAISVKCRNAEIIWVLCDVEEVPFNNGCFSCDLTFFIRANCEVFTGFGRPTEVNGLCIFNKRIILFGSEGNAKIFQSKFREDEFDIQMSRNSNLPTCVVECVDPIPLAAKLVENCCCNDDHRGPRGFSSNGDNTLDLSSVPESICKMFGAPLVVDGERQECRLSLGLFSIVRLERDTQIVVPATAFCVPEKQCVEADEENPCGLFDQIRFPINEFFPPEKNECMGDCLGACAGNDVRGVGNNACGCGRDNSGCGCGR